MNGFVEAPRAWSLTRGMASAVGVSLPHAVIEGALSRRDLASLVDRCQSCGQSAVCMQWLAQAARAKALPVYCANKADIEALLFLA